VLFQIKKAFQMNTMIKKLNLKMLMLIGLVSALMFVSNSCNKNDGGSSQIVLSSFGPGAVMRGQQLKFIGNNLNQVTSVILPDNVEVTTFVTKTSTLLAINVPDATVDGLVTLKTPQGDITTKTKLVVLEPITITSIAPTSSRPGATIKIQGTYLNLVASVTFGRNKTVAKANFASQSATEINVIVPNDAQTAKIALADAQTIPNVIQSTDVFTVTTPVATSLSPTTVKAGANLTITGTDLDLTKDINFTGGTRVASANFVSQSATQIVVIVPADAKDGPLALRPLSEVQVPTSAITLVAPTVSVVAPNPGKNGGTISVTGTDLDLVSQVTFGGGKTGTIQSGGSATSITVGIPKDALDGKVKFSTKSAKWDSTQSITLVKPTITTFTASVNTKNVPSITIDGTNVDLTSNVIFQADSVLFPPNGTITAVQADITVNSSGEIVVKVPQGAKTGKFTLVTTNGTQLKSSSDLTIVPDMPIVTSLNPAGFVAGKTITFTAASGLDVPLDVVFPNGTTSGLIAPMIVSKTATSLSVVVPVGAKSGYIKFINYAKESYKVPFPTLVLGPDPVVDKSLVFFDFNNTVNINYDKGVWWGDATVENNPTVTLDGSGYARYNGTLNAWTGFFWRNGGNNFPGSKIGTDISNYVVKFDISLLSAITAGNLIVTMKTATTEYDAMIGPGAPTPTALNSTFGGWKTITIPLTSFKDGYGWGTNGLTDLSLITADFGMAYSLGGSPSSSSSAVNIAIDNVRFEHKP